MAIGYELIKELGVLSQGRNPVWKSQATVSAPNGAPSLPTDGVALGGAVAALLAVKALAGPGEIKIWMLPDGQDTWFVASGGEQVSFSESWVQRATVAGIRRMYIEVTSTTGAVTPMIGPCLEGV